MSWCWFSLSWWSRKGFQQLLLAISFFWSSNRASPASYYWGVRAFECTIIPPSKSGGTTLPSSVFREPRVGVQCLWYLWHAYCHSAQHLGILLLFAALRRLLFVFQHDSALPQAKLSLWVSEDRTLETALSREWSALLSKCLRLAITLVLVSSEMKQRDKGERGRKKKRDGSPCWSVKGYNWQWPSLGDQKEALNYEVLIPAEQSRGKMQEYPFSSACLPIALETARVPLTRQQSM